MNAESSLGVAGISQAKLAAKQLVFVARSGDDSARWGETYVKIRAKHLAAFLRATEADRG
jgi:hypothetical protein